MEIDKLYLVAISIGLSASYALLLAFFPYFFTGNFGSLRRLRVLSVATIFIGSILGSVVSFLFTDAEWGNRFLHAFGGGFLAFLTCYLAARDSGVAITKFQFFVLSSLITCALGVSNELIEFYLQLQTGVAFAESINDTWLDLVSNTVGAGIAACIFTPCIARRH